MSFFKTADNNFGTALLIVDSVAGQGTHTTIAAAIADASSGQTIFIRPGTYTENLTLKAGVNLTAFGCDSGMNGGGTSVANVVISGTCTFTGAGTVTISGIQLQTNSAACLAVTGSSASIVNLVNCHINVLNNTAISYTSSSSDAQINLSYCTGNIATTGITYHTMTSAGSLRYVYCRMTNSGLSTTASSNSSGPVALIWCNFESPFSTSSSAAMQILWTSIDTSNVTAITTSGTGFVALTNCSISSGTASALSAGSGSSIRIYNGRIDTTNSSAIVGAGTLEYGPITFTNTGDGITTTTQTPKSFGPRLLIGGDCQIVSGSGSPNGSVTAPKGSLYLRTDGSSSSTRAYINTNSSTSWTAITTSS